MEKFPEDKLTPSDEIYIEPNSDTRVGLTLKVEETLERVNTTSSSSATGEGSSSSGGTSISIPEEQNITLETQDELAEEPSLEEPTQEQPIVLDSFSTTSENDVHKKPTFKERFSSLFSHKADGEDRDRE